MCTFWVCPLRYSSPSIIYSWNNSHNYISLTTFFSSILLASKSFWLIPFNGCIFFNYLAFEIIIKFCVFLIFICKKGVIEYIYEYYLKLVECKFAWNGFTDWKTFLTNIFRSIIWHLFAGESSCDNHCNLLYRQSWW